MKTPQEKLDEIEKEIVTAWPTQGHRNELIIWLISRVRELENALEHIANDSFVETLSEAEEIARQALKGQGKSE